MDTSSTWSSFCDRLPPQVLYKDAVDAEIIRPGQYATRSQRRVSLFSVKESRLIQILDKTWSSEWETAGWSQDKPQGVAYPDSYYESNEVLNEIRGAIHADDSATQLLLFPYSTDEGPMSRVLDVLGRELSLELDLFLPHFWREDFERRLFNPDLPQESILFLKNIKGIHTAHRLTSHRTVLCLGGYSLITAQICKTAIDPQRSLVVAIVDNAMVARPDRIRMIGSMRSQDWLMAMEDFFGFHDMCLQSLKTLPAVNLERATNNPFVLLSPFVWGSISVWFRRLEAYRDDSDNTGSKIEDVERDWRALREMRETMNTVFGGSLFPNPENSRDPGLLRDFNFVVEEYEIYYNILREKFNYEASSASLKASLASLEESRRGIQQNHSVKRLTQLAFVFIPLSFITSTFGMNVDVLTGDKAKWWTVLIGAVIVYFIVGVPFLLIRWRDSRKRSGDEVNHA